MVINGTKVLPIKAVVVRVKEPRVSKSKVGKRTVMVTTSRAEQALSDEQSVQLGDTLYVNPRVYAEMEKLYASNIKES